MEPLFTLACQDHLPGGATLGERLANLRRYGFDAVELRGYGLLDRLEETRSALAETGVPVATICAGFRGSLVHPEPSQRRQAIDDCKRLLDLAEEWGARGLIIAADYGTPPLPDLISVRPLTVRPSSTTSSWPDCTNWPSTYGGGRRRSYSNR